MALLASSQVSDGCLLGYLFFSLNFGIEIEKFTLTALKSRMSAKLGQIRPLTAELAAFKRLEKIPLTYNGRHVVNP